MRAFRTMKRKVKNIPSAGVITTKKALPREIEYSIRRDSHNQRRERRLPIKAMRFFQLLLRIARGIIKGKMKTLGNEEITISKKSRCGTTIL
jgi:hypothetical protein